jgi:hypothetical protein
VEPAAEGAAGLDVEIGTIVNAGKPDTMSALVKWAAWTLATVLAIFYIGRAPLIRRVVTRACLAVGLQGVVLPLATLVSFLVAGERLAGSAGIGGERTVEYVGLRLAGQMSAVWVALGGFCVGLALVIVGDRARRRPGRRHGGRHRRLSRGSARSTRARHR